MNFGFPSWNGPHQACLIPSQGYLRVGRMGSTLQHFVDHQRKLWPPSLPSQALDSMQAETFTPTRDWTCASLAVEVPSLHHWTAREVPIILILRKEIFSKVGKSKVYFCSDAQYLNKSSVSLCLCQDNWKSCKVLCIIYCLCIYYYYLDNWCCIYCNLSKC